MTLKVSLEAINAERIVRSGAITIADYPELKLLCWNVHVGVIDGETAIGIYERNWHHVHQNLITKKENKLIGALITIHRNGVFTPFDWRLFQMKKQRIPRTRDKDE